MTRTWTIHQWRRLGGLSVAGALALTGCGTNENAPSGGNGAEDLGVACASGAVQASGSSAQANAMDEWIKKYQSACSGTTINYQSVGSGAGVQQFIQGSTAFAGSDSAVKPDEAEAFHICGHIWTTGSCPSPLGLPRVDRNGYPLRPSDGRRSAHSRLRRPSEIRQ